MKTALDLGGRAVGDDEHDAGDDREGEGARVDPAAPGGFLLELGRVVDRVVEERDVGQIAAGFGWSAPSRRRGGARLSGVLRERAGPRILGLAAASAVGSRKHCA